MSVSSTIATIKQKMTEFKIELLEALDAVTDRAPYADVADKLSYFTPDQVIAQLRAQVTEHTSKLGVGVHKVNPEALGTYTRDQFDVKFDQMLDIESGIPLSFYGDREFLPPAVTGSFESGSNTTPWGFVAMMLEDNGTLMVLRTGTDGDTAGLFYSYLRNAQEETDLTNMVMSNVQYSPAFIPAGMKPFAVVNGSQDIIVGIVVNAATLERTGYFISVTNNTMDHTKHTGVFVPNDSILNVVMSGASMLGNVSGYIKNGYCYLLCSLDASRKFGWSVYRIPLNNLIAGSWSGVERVTGWTINRGNSGTIVSDDILLFDNFDDAFVQIGQPFLNNWPANSSPSQFPMVREDGRVIMMSQRYWQLHPGDNKVGIPGFVGSWTIEIPDNKIIDCAKYHNQKIVMNYTGVGFEVSVAPAYAGATVNSWIAYAGGQACNSWYTTKYNQMWYWTTTSYFSNRTLYRIPGNPVQDPLDLFQMRTPAIGGGQTLGSAMYGRHGSAVTVSFYCIGNIGGNTLTLKNMVKPAGKPYGAYSVKALLLGEPTFQYNSVTGNYAYRGFAPTIQRYTLSELGISDITNIVMLNEGDASGYKVSHGRFTMNTGQWLKAGNIDENLAVSGAIMTSQAVMDSIQNQIRANFAARGIQLYAAATTPMLFELNVPQLYGDMPLFVFGTYILSDQRLVNFVYTATLTAGTRQSIQGVSLQTGTYVQNIWYGSGGLDLTPDEETGQNCIRRVAGGFVLGIIPAVLQHVVGNSGKSTNLLTYNGTWAFKGTPIWHQYRVSPQGWVNLPSRGLFYVLTSEFIDGEIDCGSKMLGVRVESGTLNTRSMQEAYALFRDSNNCIVVLSQKTVSAWTVYFSDPTPAMLDGTFQIVDPLTYELNPAVDGNKTFYVWLVKVNNVISYRIVQQSNATPSDVQASLYLGYFTTAPEGIQKVVVEKRTAIGGMVLARESQGSGIPLTSGTPNTAGYLNWR